MGGWGSIKTEKKNPTEGGALESLAIFQSLVAAARRDGGIRAESSWGL